MTQGDGYILVVDDDDSIREVLTCVLQAYGFRVLGAADGVDALDRLRAGPAPRLILLDMMMPRMDGEELMRQLRAAPGLRAVPVVVMSGQSEARARARALGAEGCLVKPVELDELLSTVRWFTEKRAVG